MIVIDASVTLSWCFPDEQSPLSLKVLERLKAGEAAIVPAFWSFEVMNSLLIGEKRGRISAAQTQSFLDDLKALGPLFDYASAEQVYGPIQKLCRDHKLTPYDALYVVDLAMRKKMRVGITRRPSVNGGKSAGYRMLVKASVPAGQGLIIAAP